MASASEPKNILGVGPRKGPQNSYKSCIIAIFYRYQYNEILLDDSEFVMTHLIEGPKARFQPKQIGMAQTTVTYL